MSKMRESEKEWGFETLAIHAGQAPDKETGAIMTPIYMSSTFVHEAPGKHKGYEYSRTANPTRTAYEDCFAQLEGGSKAFAFASGCAAMTTVMHLLPREGSVLACDDMYGGTVRLFNQVLSHRALKFHYADFTQIEKVKSALNDIENIEMVWLESPTNPMLKLADIAVIAKLCRDRGILLAVDNTFMSPFFQQPIQLGADIVVHSATKFINGHTDVVGGIVVVKEKSLAERMAFLVNSIGAIASPFDAYICMRSLKTLALRMRAHEENAFAIASFLSDHPKVQKVIYPGLPSHPQHALAKKQMSGMGGIITFELKSNAQETYHFLSSLRLFALAESLGGVESLAESPALMTHAGLSKESRKQLGISDSLVRLSVGIENKKDLIEDLKKALL